MKALAAFSTAVLIAATVTTGCAGPSPSAADPWLIAVDGDTAYVSDLAEVWAGMDEAARAAFRSRDNPVEHMVDSYTGRMLLDRELAESGILTDPETVSFGRSWLRLQASRAARNHFLRTAESSVSGADIQFFKDHMGKTVWFTFHPGTDSSEDRGPDHLPELDRQLALHLDSMSAGETGEYSGGVRVRLDSVFTTDPALVAETLADTAHVNSMAVSRTAGARVRRWIDDVKKDLSDDFSVAFDSSAVERLAAFYSGEAEFAEEPVISSALGNWTSSELRTEIDFRSTRVMVQPSSVTWQYYFIDNLCLQAFLEDTLEKAAPDLLDSLRAEADEYMKELALERLYHEKIETQVSVDPGLIEEMYSDLQEPLMIEEQRILQAVTFPEDSIIAYREAIETGRLEEFISGLNGFQHLAADPGNPQYTVPLSRSEVPGGYGDMVFGLEPSDTTVWLGPQPMSEGMGQVMFRLVEVLPEREADLEEATPALENIIRAQLKEEATVRWMQELRERYGPVVNREVLNSLPDDPDRWQSL
ncbi:MAG: peptidylprolyl isomerase [Candidatus Aegiribacteria sp.]